MTVYEGWDGEGDYEPPVKVGDRVRLARGDTVIVSPVVQTDGFFPNVVALEWDTRVDLQGWDVEVIGGASVEADVFVKNERMVELIGPTVRATKSVHIIETLNGRYLVEPTPRADGSHVGRWIGPPDGMAVEVGLNADIRAAIMDDRDVTLFGKPYVPKVRWEEALDAAARVGVSRTDDLRVFIHDRHGWRERETTLLDQCEDLERERNAALTQRAAIAEQWAADKVVHAEQVRDLEKQIAVLKGAVGADERILRDVALGQRVILPTASGGVVYVPLAEFDEYRNRLDAEVDRYRDALGDVRGAVAKAREILAPHDVAAVFPRPHPRPT